MGQAISAVDALGVERTSIVGCSFGGFLALNQASLTPERVDRVVLISPAGTFVGLALERMPGLEGAIVPDADHIAAMAQPNDVTERIIRFLAERHRP